LRKREKGGCIEITPTLQMKKSKASDLAQQYRVTDGRKFCLKDYETDDTWKLKSKEHAAELLEKGRTRLQALQDVLYAQDKWALLLIFQAMDAAGKDSAIKHVMSGINPQGCQVYSFKAPSTEDILTNFVMDMEQTDLKDFAPKAPPEKSASVITAPAFEKHFNGDMQDADTANALSDILSELQEETAEKTAENWDWGQATGSGVSVHGCFAHGRKKRRPPPIHWLWSGDRPPPGTTQCK